VVHWSCPAARHDAAETTEREPILLSFLRRHGYFIFVAVTVLVLDQATKWAVIQNIPLYSSVPDRGFFRFTHIPNTGSAFGLFGGQNSVLIIAALIGVTAIALVYRSQRNPGIIVRTSLALMIAGAIGNLADRIQHGWVTDFIDVGPWFIFNIADASIVTGVIALALSPLVTKPAPEPAPPLDPPPTDDAISPTISSTPMRNDASPEDTGPEPTPAASEANPDEQRRD
jgi:signal peptidase II